MNLRFFPNSITLLNLFIGCIVVLLLVENNIEVKYVFVLSVFCLILDFLDGYIARKLNAKSELGLQLDSLADMVSFGLVPGVLLYNMFLNAPSSSVGSIFSSFVPFTGFVITLCSAYRLAKFNTLKTNSKFFKGLPAPANTMFIYSFSIISNNGSAFSDMISNYNVIIFITLICGFLLVSNLKLLNFKFKSLKFIGNRRRFLIIFVSVPSIIIYGIYAIPLILGLYVLISIGTYYKLKT
mgnify:FL=1